MNRRFGQGLGPPPPFVRLGSRRNGPRRLRPWVVAAVVAGALGALIVLSVLKSLYLDLLWFRSVGFGSVYTTRIADQKDIVCYLI